MLLKNIKIFIFIIILYLNIAWIDCDEFGYEVGEQAKWVSKYYKCAGLAQSPIRIITKDAEIANIPPLIFNYYDIPLPGPITIKNNGHTVSVKLPPNGSMPEISGADLPGVYEADSFHFHWGGRMFRGSEHVIDKIRYPFEMHIVHINKKYRRYLNIAKEYSDGIVVLAVFYKFSLLGGNGLVPIVQHLPNVIKSGQKVVIEKPSFSMSSLYPGLDTSTFYIYTGSLTTPPCSEGVTWFLFPGPPLPYISLNQLRQFRKIKKGDGHPLYDNFRVVQALNMRKIRIRRGS